ncbi:MAG: ABC transporter permease [Limnochordia bacterium]|jgi:spermidine/putrescine transport system permease protein|nr:ABC transporter permease [Bacillota bacterium]NLH31318.1 ABC transporter permease [Bacillota bacterium]HOB09461.1 ABC transporter permease [Limnochordia bacterium]HPZ31335.1 ABC transporter permease [Limnochordia bacterium]HQD71020.1 ABC transporter permease [Limnochordia bacterium]
MSYKWAASPYLVWMVIFIVVPIILVCYYSLTVRTDAGFRFSTDNFRRFFEPIYLKVLYRSIELAFVATVVCFILGYPLAYILARSDFKHTNVLIMLLVVPMWMNFLLRTYAWMTILEQNGVLNIVLSWLRLPTISILYTEAAVILGMVYNFLPFMVLPIYSVLSKIDPSVVEAAEDLGANGIIVFRKVIFPLSLPGVISGITMVFMPAVTTFVISRLLGGGQFTLIGNLIEQQFLYVSDWGFGSAISLAMMVLILLSMAVMSKFAGEDRGLGLW